MPHTNVSKLIYVAPTPKNTPTKAKVKSIHRYTNITGQKTNQNIKNDEVLRKRDFSRKTISDEFLKSPPGLKEFNNSIDKVSSRKYMKYSGHISDIKTIKNKESYINDFKDETFMKKKETTNRIQTKKNLDNCITKKKLLESPRSSLSCLTVINQNTNLTSHLSSNQTNIKEGIVKSNISEVNKQPFVELKGSIQSQKENRNFDENIYLEKKNGANKDEIKKRLQELHRNSLKILETNLKKVRNCSDKPKISKKSKNCTKVKKLTQNDIIFPNPFPLKNQINSKNEINDNIMLLDKLSVKSGKSEIRSKVGLLRNSKSDETIFNDIKDYNISKGNDILKCLSISNTNFVTENRSNATNFVPKQSFDYTRNETFETKSQETESQQESNNKSKSEKAVQVEISLNNKENIPISEKYKSNDFIKSVQLQTSFSERENIEVSKKMNIENVPYWLEQTSVEIYPYNFITAVRKKLEILTNPVKKTEDQCKENLNMNFCTTYQETPLSRSKSENDNVRRRIIDNLHFGKSNSNRIHSQILTENELDLANKINISNILVDKNISSNNVPNKIENSHSISEMISNFSSISILCPEPDTISDISSAKSEAQMRKVQRKKISKCRKNSVINYENNENDDTTISSSVFSTSEHKDLFKSSKQPKYSHIEGIGKSIDQPSPLSLHTITNLQIKMKRENSNNHIANHLSEKLSEELNSQIDIKSSNENKGIVKSDQNISQLDQLLEDFNKNLSQVIDVNNQLKTTLDKSQRDFTPPSKKELTSFKKNNTPKIPKISSSSFITAVEYTSDFEDDASNTTFIGPINNTEINYNDKHNATCLKLLDTFSPKSDIESIKENIQNVTPSLQSDKIALISPKIEIINSTNNANKDNFIKNHVNAMRGNDDGAFTNQSSTLVYVADPKTEQQRQYLELPMRNEYVAIYNKSDIEISMILQDENKNVSDISENYSSIGVYEQLLQSENLKTEQLTALLKIREKILVDRTKSQIAWLEVQKEKFKHKGLSEQITAIKKKQRAILIKMEKEREELKKSINSQQHNSIYHSGKLKDQNQKSLFKTYIPKLSESLSNITIRKGLSITTNKIESPTKSVRAYDIGSSQNLVKLLERREEELKHRRKHVNRLMAWHKRLDEEEEEVYQIEQSLLNCNKNMRLMQPKESLVTHINTDQPNLSHQELKNEKKIIKIEKSLEKLQNISRCSTKNSNVEDYVRISGLKLNKLWTRLTGQKMNRFDSYKKYKFTKTDLEKFYEKAKEKVLEEFDKSKNLEKFLDKSLQKNLTSVESNYEKDHIEQTFANILDIPSLYLNFSSQSDVSSTLESPVAQSNNDQNFYKPNSAISGCENKKVKNIEVSEVTSNINPTATTDMNEIKNVYEQENQSFEISLNAALKISKDLKKNVEDSNLHFETDILLYEHQEPLSYGSDSMHNCNETQIQEHNSSVTKNTLILKEIFDSPNTTQKSIETHTITNNIAENLNAKNSELVRPSVIVSSNSYQNEIFKQKNETNSVTILELNPKHQTMTSLIKLCRQSSGSTQTSDQITESISNSKKSSSSILLEKMKNDQSTVTTNSLSAVESILFSPDKTIFSSEMRSQKQVSNNPFVENTFKKKIEYNYQYNNDFPESGLTNLENISVPIFDTTMELFKTNESVFEVNRNTNSKLCCESKNFEFSKDSDNTTELEKRLIVIDESLKDLNQTIEKVLSPEKENSARNTTRSITINSDNSTISVEKTITSVSTMKKSFISAQAIEKHTDSFSSTVLDNTKDSDKIILMPDIINEVEIRRRQQISIENDIKQLENTIPYVVFREIPNKPPPPYVPPAPGSPMTTIFPPESRIKEITFRRTAELFKELTDRKENLQQFNSKNSILNEHITNIYERIILDICRECIQEYKEIFHGLNPEYYKKSLALYNPPDKLNCIQKFIYCRVKKLLAIENNRHRKGSIFSIAKKKQDHVDEILIQELFEEEYKWTNFDVEELEVNISIVESILNDVIKDVVIDVVNVNKNVLN